MQSNISYISRYILYVGPPYSPIDTVFYISLEYLITTFSAYEEVVDYKWSVDIIYCCSLVYIWKVHRVIKSRFHPGKNYIKHIYSKYCNLYGFVWNEKKRPPIKCIIQTKWNIMYSYIIIIKKFPWKQNYYQILL